jgi:anaphase-promoting complex subunit 4
MDLVATAMNSGVTVFRLNGQKVFGIASSGAWTVVKGGLTWRSDGLLLAIAGSDAVVRVVNAFSGKIVHQLSASVDEFAPPGRSAISSFSWSPCFANNIVTTKQQLDATGDGVALDDLLGLNPQISTLLRTKADLPRALGELDVESSLPKLATLPSTGGDDDVFSSRTSIDAIFHNSKAKTQTDMVDVLLTAYEDIHATTNIKIFSSFEIGGIHLSSSIPSNNPNIPSKVIFQGSHPFSHTYFLIVQHAKSLHLLRLDLNFIPQTSPHYLPLLATKATQLENLLRYLAQIESQLSHEIKAAFDLPSRYLGNLTESIKQQNQEADLRSEIWHLICTGECSEVMREWLVDEVGERGVKRWEKGVGDALEVVRRAVSECVLPCLERIYFVLSRLEGFARFGKSRKVLGLDERMIDAVRATVDVVNLLCNDLLKKVGEELRAFESFIKWLKGEVEVQGLEASSERREELSTQRGDEVDCRAVLRYVESGLISSSAFEFLKGGLKGDKSSFMAQEDREEDESHFYERYKQMRSKAKEPNSTTPTHRPKLDEVIHRLRGQCAKVLEGIAMTLKKSIQHSHVLTLNSDCSAECVDMRILSHYHPDAEGWEILIVTRSAKSSQQLHLTRVESVGTTTKPESIAHTTMEHGSEVVDLKFMDETHIMVLLANDGESSLQSWDVYELKEATLMHRFSPQQSQSRPKKLEVNSRKGRRVVCVLDQDGMRYEIFDLDNLGEQDGDEAGDDEAMME